MSVFYPVPLRSAVDIRQWLFFFFCRPSDGGGPSSSFFSFDELPKTLLVKKFLRLPARDGAGAGGGGGGAATSTSKPVAAVERGSEHNV